ncbi:hypothetical protein DH2020_023017 [Rehmannia glutinosa]|uniref:Uncharacterized protein n=1 Tax=Rehmannia glutinosa TaxID=99300 RepID=A0ABR0W9A2_REHGL
MHSPEHPSGTATPPLQTLASVPFKWEEQPGKPRPCTDIIVLPGPAKCLELPPCRMLLMDPTNKMPSPTTVLDGPYAVGRPMFSSFRFFREAQCSFDSTSSDSPRSSVDVLLGNKSKGQKTMKRFNFGRGLRFKSGKKEVDGGSFGFSSPSSTTGCDGVERLKMEGQMRRNGSFSGHSQAATTARLCATLYEKLKHAIPWRSTRKSKKEGLRLKECDV